MKHLKLYENTEIKYHNCIIYDNGSHDIDYSIIFETKKDMENWVLNYINENIGPDIEPDEVNHYEGAVLDDKEGVLFFILEKAIDWYSNNFDVTFYFKEVELCKNEKLGYGVEFYQTTNKYNL